MANMSLSSAAHRLFHLLTDRWYFRALILSQALSASWIALSGRYPMAFDEDYHFGIIKLYAHHFSPIWSGQPGGADVYGGVWRDPSFLYHWLLGIIYRPLAVVIQSERWQVIILRLINVGLFCLGLYVLERLIALVEVTKLARYLVITVLVALPISSMLAAQINYDNLLLVAVFGFLFLTVQLGAQLRRGQLKIKTLLAYLAVGSASCLIKYAFLPILAASVIYFAVLYMRDAKLTRRSVWRSLRLGWSKAPKWTITGLAIIITLMSALCIERYGGNLWRYHTPLPECDQVLSVDRCWGYGPWRRNYIFAHSTDDNIDLSLVSFTGQWFKFVSRSLFYVLNGAHSNYQVGEPLDVLWFSCLIFGLLGVGLALRYLPRLVKRHHGRLFLLIMLVVYSLILWLQNYSDYKHLGRPVAQQGRYLLPVLPILVMFMVLAYQQWLQTRQRLAWNLVALALISFTQGGGLTTYLVRTDANWYFERSPMIKATDDLRRLASPFIIKN